jgi:hypothetical protein
MTGIAISASSSSSSEAYHTEDMVLVGADGPRRLTEPQDALLVIG